MKTLNIFIILFLLVAGNALANEKLTQALEKGLGMMEKARTSDEVQLAANHFERIASAKPKEWLPLYYAAYANLTAGLYLQDDRAAKKDELYDKALNQLNGAETISKDNSEIYTLKGYVVLMKMAVDPMSRAPKMMREGMGLLGKAKALNPANPRPYFVEGQFTFYMPEAFGGGKVKAKPILQTGKEKYDAEKQESSISPKWGRKSLEELLVKCG